MTASTTDNRNKIASRSNSTVATTTNATPYSCKKNHNNSNKSTKFRQLRFHEIEFIELPVTIGDNPCVRDGAPVTCGWNVQRRVTVQVDFFETNRPKRRPIPCLLLSKQVRENVLLRNGCSKHEIVQASIQAQQTKVNRSQSNICLKLSQRQPISKVSSVK